IGAGGAAKSTVWALQREGASVTLFARDLEAARRLAEKRDIDCSGLAGAAFNGFDLVVNATPVGTRGQSEGETGAATEQLRGALGSAQAESLARAGVGQLRIADRDFVESSNLQRQTMFTEDDAAEHLPKAIACANHIAKINSEITVEPEVSDVNHSNIERLIEGCDVVLDGTDNFATRYLTNDACVKNNVNWVYGA